LRRLVPEITDPDDLRYGNIGFHLAGFVDNNGEDCQRFITSTTGKVNGSQQLILMLLMQI
jgi:hypothetical protein